MAHMPLKTVANEVKGEVFTAHFILGRKDRNRLLCDL
jgi:hypothetical protein